MKRLLLAMMGTLIIPSMLFAQSGKVSGVVRDAKTHEPLAGVTVVVEGTVLGAPTDVNGKFSITSVPAGERVIKAAAVGYNSESKTINVEAGATASADFVLQPNPIQTAPVVVTGMRAVEKETPVAFSNVTSATIKKEYTVQDVPMLLKNLPGVYAWADGGVGLGDANIAIRGFSQDRIETMINGIPENDPESRRIYWNDFPDLLSNVSSIQVQRGVGSSLYGSDALAGSIDIETANYSSVPSLSLTGGVGSFDLSKVSAAANSGIIDNRFAAYARVSHLKGNGYRDYSWADYWGYFIGGAMYYNNLTLKLNFYQSPERNHYSYIYPTLAQIAQYGRKYNGMGTGSPEGQLYNINVYNQPHYELHINYDVNPETQWNTSLFYIRGNGYGQHWTTGYADSYFPNFIVKNAAGNYVFVTSAGDSVSRTPLAYRSITDNYQFGLLSNLTYKLGKNDLVAGIELRRWHAHHYGEIQFAGQTPAGYVPGTALSHFYDYTGQKYVIAGFIHTLWRVDRFNIMADLQYSAPTYYLTERFIGSGALTQAVPRTTLLNDYKTPFSFLTPRVGVTYNVTKPFSVYANFSQAKEEPSQGSVYASGLLRTDLKPEFMNADIELGANYVTSNINVKLDYFFMNFANELIDVYSPNNPNADSRGNILYNGQHTVHQGVEFDGRASLMSNLQVNLNFTYSNNQFKDQIIQTGATTSVNYSGKFIPHFPVTMLNVGATYTYKNAYISLMLNSVGKQYIDNLNQYGTVDPYTVLNAVVGYSFDNVMGLKSIGLTLNVNNLTNTQYFSYGTTYGTTPEYLPGAPANYFVTTNLDW